MGAALALVLMPSAVMAQDADAAKSPDAAKSSDDQIQEIVVTAQFTSQNVRDVPISITAVSGETLEARGQTSLTDIGQSTPGLAIRPSGQYGNATAVTIRGVGNFNALYGYEPGVGIYIDDVYYPTLYGSQLDLLDLDRIEVLRGPQGTLAGKNSIGGAVKLYSRAPTGKGDGYVEATIGERNQRGMRAAADFTLVPDRLFFRISGVYKSVDGYVNRIDYKCRNPTANVPTVAPQYDLGNCKIGTEGGTDYGGVRGALRYLSEDERLDATLQFDVYKDTSDAQPDRLVTVNPASPNAALLTPFLDSGKYESYSTFQTQTGRGFEGVNRLKGYGFSGRVSYDLADHLNFTSITAYRSYNAGYQVDIDGTPYGMTTEDLHLHFNWFTQEVRLGGSFLDNVIEYTLGGYYYKATGNQAGLLQISGTVVPPPTVPTSFVLNALQGDIIKSESKAAFLNTIIHPVENLDIAAGIRWTDDSKDYFYHRRDANTLLPISPPDGLGGSFSGDRIDYRVALSYHISPSIMAYGSISTGFKGGGVNPAIYRAEQIVEFGPEKLTAYELGTKASLFDRHLTIDVSGYYNKYNDIQLIITSGTGIFAAPASVPVNGGAATIKGVEVEANASFGGFSADASFSTLDFKYTDITAGTGIKPNFITPYTPKTKWSAGAQYALDLSGGLSLTPRIDVSHQSGIYSLAINAPTNYSSGFTTANAHLKLQSEDGHWSFDLAASNLFNKYYYTSRYANLYGLMGTISGQVAPPRQISGTLRYNF
ncbi:MAG: TonB-dependent receptor [Candidatus Andeanibacterium colombiense]|uniref:TonB-dependent receptor n=1 Tax=Candidatus Andeanibacterium colombiense TaxID=3121345 RepID=A0AAJ5X629_9SPHN|nr:MAG: TonB-dependent receptor [Sphingomonadaceae bacterium]